MNYFFTGDTHFNHVNILKYSNRPFSSIEEMNEKLIQNWNEIVTKNDIVYHLGDFSFGNVNKYLSRLNGNITILYGSHDKDKSWPRMVDVYPSGLTDEFGNKRLIVLCHYSMRSWPKSHYASWHLYGHHHGKLESNGLSFDVGVDCNNYYPFSLEDISKKMATLKPIVDFRKLPLDKNGIV